MVMVLPKGVPTLQHLNTKNWTRPDNVFCTEHTQGLFVKCATDPANRGPKTDHVPVLSVLDLTLTNTNPEPRHNFRATNWEKFRETLRLQLNEVGPPTALATDREFQNAARALTRAIQETIEKEVPLCKPSPYAKRWW
ncbi:hypothetical protein PISMIDRAFT_76012, partial [Pisolithus microcarpus 441]